MIVLIDGVKYEIITPDSELTLEKSIEKNYRYIFGKDSFYFNLKKRITSRAGVGSIPDAYLIVFDTRPRWCILEVELATHPLYEHVIPQLTKFNRGIEDGASRKKIIDMLYDAIKEDQILEARLREKIGSGEIYKFISEVINNEPTIIIAIDEKTNELDEAIKDIRGDVKILEFKTFRREAITDSIEVYLFNPMVKPKTKGVEREGFLKQVKPVRTKTILPKGIKLHNTYKGEEFKAEVIDDKNIKFNGQIYGSVSSAAVAAIKSTGSSRTTEDGWRWWKFVDPTSGKEKTIDILRKGELEE